MDASIKKTVRASDKDAQYDEKAKKLLGHKIILAYILVNTIEEFREMNPKGIILTGGPNSCYEEGAPTCSRELFEMGIIPIVNENDTVSTYEMQFGDNDSLSAIVASLVGADLLILLSDIDGLYTDDPRKNPKAELIPVVEKIDNRIENMAGDTVGSDVGTGGMTTKLTAARIATLSGADMIIANAKDVGVLHQIFEGKQVGTFFKANKNDDFYIADYVEESME